MKRLVRLLAFNSFETIGVTAFLLLGLVLSRGGLSTLDLAILAVYAVVAVALRLALRTPPEALTSFDTLAQVGPALRGRLPTLMEFYSDNCAFCMAQRPALDRLERETAGNLRVMRVDVADAIGAELVKRYSVNLTPTFLLFNSNGVDEDQFALVLDRARVLHWLNQQTIAP